jgi:putative CocE/NonD family hydrolase
MAERQDLDGRGDVAVFETAPLSAPLALCGPADLTLHVASPAASLDVSAVLSLVTPDGRARTLTQGFARPARRDPATVSLRSVCATVAPGERLRLSLAGTAFPAFAVNPGTGARPETTPPLARRPVAFAALTGGTAPSHLTLTVA